MNFPIESFLGVTGVALIGLVFAAWNKSRALLFRLFGFAINSVELEGPFMISAFMHKCWVEARSSRLSARCYTTNNTFVRDLDRTQLVLFLRTTANMTFWHNGLPFWISGSKEGTTNNSHYQSPRIKVHYIRRFFDIERFLVEAVEEINREENSLNEFRVMYLYGSRNDDSRFTSEATAKTAETSGTELFGMHPITHNRDNLGCPVRRDATAKLVLTTAAKEVVREIDYWNESRQWFKDRGIAWKRGYLLVGPPGTGKTSFARSIAERLNIPMFVFDLASMDNSDLGSKWKYATSHGRERVIVLEDLDSVFRMRENITVKGKSTTDSCTFDCLLQLIDGADRMEGTLLFITTNHPENLDPAIGGGTTGVSERAGRVDRVLHFPYLDMDGALVIAKRILGDVLDPYDLRNLAREGHGMAPVNFQELCFQRALELRFRDAEPVNGAARKASIPPRAPSPKHVA